MSKDIIHTDLPKIKEFKSRNVPPYFTGGSESTQLTFSEDEIDLNDYNILPIGARVERGDLYKYGKFYLCSFTINKILKSDNETYYRKKNKLKRGNPPFFDTSKYRLIGAKEILEEYDEFYNNAVNDKKWYKTGNKGRAAGNDFYYRREIKKSFTDEELATAYKHYHKPTYPLIPLL